MKANRFNTTIAKLSLGLFTIAIVMSSCAKKGTCPAYGGQVLPEKKAVWAMGEKINELQLKKI